MDPESGFDAVRNVGILDGKIAVFLSSPSRERLYYVPQDMLLPR